MRKINLLNIKPGDKLVILSDQKLSGEQHEHIMIRVKKWAGDIPVIILGKGFVLSKVSKKGRRKRRSRQIRKDVAQGIITINEARDEMNKKYGLRLGERKEQ